MTRKLKEPNALRMPNAILLLTTLLFTMYLELCVLYAAAGLCEGEAMNSKKSSGLGRVSGSDNTFHKY